MGGKPCGIRPRQKRRGQKDWVRTRDGVRLEIKVDSAASRSCGTLPGPSPAGEGEYERRRLGLGMRQLVDQSLKPPALPNKQAVLVLPTGSSPFRMSTAHRHPMVTLISASYKRWSGGMRQDMGCDESQTPTDYATIDSVRKSIAVVPGLY